MAAAVAGVALVDNGGALLADAPGTGDGAQGAFGGDVLARGLFVGESDLNRAGARASWGSTGVAGDLRGRLDDNFSLTLHLGADYFKTEFSHFDRFAPGLASPLSQGVNALVAPGVTYRWDGDWTFFASPGWRYAGGDGAGVSEATLWSATAGARWRVSDTLSFTGGFAFAQRFADPNVYLPFVGFDWRFQPQWRLSLGGNEAQFLGPGLVLSYEVDSSLDLFAQVGFENVYEKFAEGSSIRNGTLRYRAASLQVGATRRFAGHWAVTASVGANVGQQYYFREANGDSLGRPSTGASPAVALRLGRFF